MKPEAVTAAGALTPEAVRSQLHRVIGSETFAKSERLSKFLRFVTEESLAGRSDLLKER